jgi:hypothetical protein
MSDEAVPILPSTSDVQSPTDNGNLQDMFSQFLKTSEENQLRHQAELSAIKAVVDRLYENSSLESTSDHVDTPPDRRQTNRRTTIFFNSAPSVDKSYVAPTQRLSSATLARSFNSTVTNLKTTVGYVYIIDNNLNSGNTI